MVKELSPIISLLKKYVKDKMKKYPEIKTKLGFKFEFPTSIENWYLILYFFNKWESENELSIMIFDNIWDIVEKNSR